MPATSRELIEAHASSSSPPDIKYADWYVLLQAETTSATLPLENLITKSVAVALEAGDVEDAVIAQSESQRRQIWRFREDLVYV